MDTYGIEVIYIYIFTVKYLAYIFYFLDLETVHFLQIQEGIRLWSQVSCRLEYWYDLEFLFRIPNLGSVFAASLQYM